MRLADLELVAGLAEERAMLARVLARLEADEPLQLVLGGGAQASAIAMAPRHGAALRRAVAGDLSRRITALDARLADLGAEP